MTAFVASSATNMNDIGTDLSRFFASSNWYATPYHYASYDLAAGLKFEGSGAINPSPGQGQPLAGSILDDWTVSSFTGGAYVPHYTIADASLDYLGLKSMASTVGVAAVVASIFGGDDLLFGSNGADVLTGFGGEDGMHGKGGGDKLFGGAQSDFLSGGLGKDFLDGGTGSDTADYAEKSKGVEVALDGATKVKVTVNGAVEDTIVNVESLNGGSAGDRFTGDGADNTFRGNGGDDQLSGRGGQDTLFGGDADDAMTGGTGSDHLYGDAGNDTLSGGAGGDFLNGGAGNDTLTGGEAEDRFYFTEALDAATNVDTITDFDHGVDYIVLAKGVFKGTEGTMFDPADFFALGSAKDLADRIIYKEGSGKLYYDFDGSASGAAVLFAVVEKGTELSQSDFLVI